MFKRPKKDTLGIKESFGLIKRDKDGNIVQSYTNNGDTVKLTSSNNSVRV